MHIQSIDLNLLHLFDAVYRLRNVSQAAEALGVSQPSASQGLARLRKTLGDPLFVRAPGGVQPTPRAIRMAAAIQTALNTLDKAFTETATFSPVSSRRTFRIHMSDIGETRFLPEILRALQKQAPGISVETFPVPLPEITDALNNASIDFAFGFLPNVSGTCSVELLSDRYVVLLRHDHPFLRHEAQQEADLDALRGLEFVAVRTHTETLRILHLLRMEDRLRLTAHHFMALPDIVGATDLCAVMPRNLARRFAARGDHAIIEPILPLRDFTVSLHWSDRFEHDPAIQWFKGLVLQVFDS